VNCKTLVYRLDAVEHRMVRTSGMSAFLKVRETLPGRDFFMPRTPAVGATTGSPAHTGAVPFGDAVSRAGWSRRGRGWRRPLPLL